MAEQQNISISLRVPSSGDSSVRALDFSVHAEIYFAHFAEELAFSKQGADLVVSGEGRGSLVLQGYFSESRAAGPVFSFADGKRMRDVELFDFSDQTEGDTSKTVETGGVGEYRSDSGDLISGVSRLGAPPPFRAAETQPGRAFEIATDFPEAGFPPLVRANIPDLAWSVTEGALRESGLFNGVFAVPGLPGLTYGIRAGTGAGQYGTFQIAPGGAWTYTPTTDITFMARGRTYPETFTVLITDAGGNTVEKPITLVITGENDAPVVTAEGAATDDIAMASGASMSGKISAADPDGGGVIVGGVRMRGAPSAFVNGVRIDDPNKYGTLSVSSDGTWTFTATTADQQAAMLALGPAETLVVKATMESKDQYGLAGSGELVITVNGTDNDPVPDNATFFKQAAEDDLRPGRKISGTLLASDPESGKVTFTLKDGGEGACGTFTLKSNGEWEYASTVNLDGMNVGEKFQEIFTVLVTDEGGNIVEKDVVVAVTGQNDLPLPIAATFEHSVLESSLMRNPVLSGHLDARDPEGGEISYALKGGSATSQYGTFSLADDGAWTYTRTEDNSFMAVGQTYEESFIAVITDDNGDSVEKTFTLIISGENNAPVTVAETFTATVSEHSLMSGAVPGGRLDAKDAENDDLFYALKPGSGVNAYGYFDLATDGIWTYTRTADITSLAKGQNYEETFIAVITDGKGGKTERAFTLTITGENDAPVITATDKSASDTFIASGSVLEGTITVLDPDSTVTIREVALKEGGVTAKIGDMVVPDLNTYGVLAVHENGTWTFTAETDEQKAHIKALGQDENLVITATLEITDSHGLKGYGELTATVNGTDNPPVPDTDSFSARTSEDDLMGKAFSGRLEAEDPEGHGAIFFLHSPSKGEYGTLDLEANGTWTYTPNTDLTFMAGGETYHDTFTVYISDLGNIIARELVITIDGDNDAPVITATDKSASDTFIVSGSALEGAITVFDPDSTVNIREVALKEGGVTAKIGDLVVPDLNTYGVLAVHENGIWAFTAETDEQKKNIKALGQDENLVITATLEITDSHGLKGYGELIATVNGTDNAPVPDGHSFSARTREDDLMSGGFSGRLEAEDPEGHDVFFFLHSPSKGEYGTLNLATNGTWTYTPNTDLTFMARGEEYHDTFTVYISDLGNIIARELVITIDGDNDAPVIPVENASDEDTNIALGHVLEGTITAFDPDAGDSIVGGVSRGEVTAKVNDTTVDLDTYGALRVNTDGTWSFSAETQDQKANVLALGEGDVLVIEAVLEATDGTVTGQGTLILTINGTNNDPVAVAAAFTRDVQEHMLMRDTVASGLLEATDPDGDPVTFSLNGSGLGQYGTFQVNADGTWIYTLTKDISFLAAGDTHEEIFTVDIADESSTRTETFTLTITGENDAPVISVKNTSDEDTNIALGHVLEGTITVLDPDSTINIREVALKEGGVTAKIGNMVVPDLNTYGVLAVHENGTWTFTAETDEQKAHIKALGQDENLVITATLEITDSHGLKGYGELTATVNGTNNPPVPDGDSFSARTSEDALMSGAFSGRLKAEDPEGLQTTFTLIGLGKGAYGTLTLEQNGAWTYTPNTDLDFMAGEEAYEERFKVLVSDGVTTVEKDFVFTIDGDNDAPVLADHAASAAEEWLSSGMALKGVITGTDPDQGDEITYSLKAGSVAVTVNDETKNLSDYGVVTVNDNGTWTFAALDERQRKNLKALGDGDKLVITASVTGKDTGGLTDESTLTIAVNGFTPEPVTVLNYEDETPGGETYSGVYMVEGATKYVLEDDSISPFITINMDEDGTFTYSFTQTGETYFSTLNAGSEPVAIAYTVNVTLPNDAITQRTLNLAVIPTNAGNDTLHITNDSITAGLAQKIRNPFAPSQSVDTSDRTFYLDRSDGKLQGDDTVLVSSYLPNIKVYTYGGNDSLTASGPMRGSVYDLGGGENTITLGAMDADNGARGNLVRSAAGTLLVDGGFVSHERKVGMLAYNSGQNVIEGEVSGQKMAGTVTLSVEGDSEPEAFAMYSENGANIVRAETVSVTAVSSATVTGMLGEDASGYNRIEAHNVNINVEGARVFGISSRNGKGDGLRNVVEASETVTVNAKASGFAIGIQAADAANFVQAGDVSVRAESASDEAMGMAAAKGNGQAGSNSLNASGNVSIAAFGKSALGVLNELGGNPLSRNEITAGGNVGIRAVANDSLSYGILNNSGICAVTAGGGVTIEAESGGSDSGFGIYSAGTTRITAASKLNILAEGNRAVGVHALRKGEVRLAGQEFHMEVLASGGTAHGGSPPSSGNAFNGPGQAGGLLASDGASLRGECSGSGTSGITVRGTGADSSDREIAALCSWSSESGKSSVTLGGASNTMASGTLEISASAAREVYGLLTFGGENTLRFNNVSIDATSTDDAAYALWTVQTGSKTYSSGANVIEAGTATISAAGVNAYGLHAQTGSSNTVTADVVNVTAACAREGDEAVAMKAEGYGAKNILEGFGSLEATITAEAGGNGTGTRLAAMHAGNGGSNTVAGYSSANTHDLISLTGDIYSHTNGTNTITTGAGDDWVYVNGNISGTGNLISTGGGNDSIHLNGPVTGLVVRGGAGTDLLVLEAENAHLFELYYREWIPELLANTSHGIERIAVMGVSLDDLDWYIAEITKYNFYHPRQRISLEYVVDSFSQNDFLENKAAFATAMWGKTGESGQYSSLADEDALVNLSASALEAVSAVDFASEAPGELPGNLPQNTPAMDATCAYGDIFLTAQTELSCSSKDGDPESAPYTAAPYIFSVETGETPADSESGNGVVYPGSALEDAGGGYSLAGLTDLLEEEKSLEELLLDTTAPESGENSEYAPEESLPAQENEEIFPAEHGMAEQAVTAYYQQGDALESDIMFMIHTLCL